MTRSRLSLSFCGTILISLFLLHWWPQAPFSLTPWIMISLAALVGIGITTIVGKVDAGTFILVITVGFSCALLSLARATHRTSPTTVDFYTGNVWMDGIISAEPDRREKVTNYTVDAQIVQQSATGSAIPAEGTVLVTDFRRYPAFAYGDRIFVTGKLTKPENDRGSALIAPYLGSQGIIAVMTASSIRRESEGNGSQIIAGLIDMKQWFEGRLNRLLPEPEASLAAGLLTGSRRGLPRNVTDDFRTVGLTHIVAISGTNITIVLTLIMGLLFWLPLRYRMLPASCAIILFTLFVGASASVVRAAIMGILGLLALTLGRQSSTRLTILWTATCMLLWNPLQLWGDAGFALSFASVTGLSELSPIVKPHLTKVPEALSIRESLTATLAAQIAAIPISLLLFGNLSLISPLANIAVAPAIPLAMLFGALCVVLSVIWMPIGLLCALPAWAFLRYIVGNAQILARIPGAALTFEYVSPWIVAGYYCALVIGVSLWKKNSSGILTKDC